MPELSRFYGIIIRMYLEAGGAHHVPHFHAYYAEYVGVFSLESLDLLAGEMPKRQIRLIEAWAELHTEELTKNWKILQSGRKPFSIKPLS